MEAVGAERVENHTGEHVSTSSKKRPGRPPKKIEPEPAIVDAFIMTIFHFFPSFLAWLKEFPDRRKQDRITYPREAIVMSALLILFLRLSSLRQWTLESKKPTFVCNVNKMLGADLERMPHGDTIEYYLEKIPEEPFLDLRRKMVQRLIRMKVLDQFRLLGYVLIALDGTGLQVFRHMHCDHCLTASREGKVLYYYHNVLEAKIVCHNGMAISIGTEYIENSDPKASKQDCELKAFYRLAPRLKRDFPQLSICLLLDGLFAAGPVFDLCEKLRWKFIITFKEGSMPVQWEEFEALKKLSTQNYHRHQPLPHICQRFRWVDYLPYQGHSLKVIECKEENKNSGDKKTFVWLTTCDVGHNCIVALANKGGRLRWKIENEGFNDQKNGGFELEHAYSTHHTAMKIFYLLIQAAHLLSQLILKGNLLGNFKAAFGSVKNFVMRLREQFRYEIVSDTAADVSLASTFQIRLDSS